MRGVSELPGVILFPCLKIKISNWQSCLHHRIVCEIPSPISPRIKVSSKLLISSSGLLEFLFD